MVGELRRWASARWTAGRSVGAPGAAVSVFTWALASRQAARPWAEPRLEGLEIQAECLWPQPGAAQPLARC